MALWPYDAFNYPFAIQRQIPQMLTMADRLFDNLDQMFEVPSSWLHESVRDRPLGHTTELINDKDRFKINLNVEHFKPEQLEVKCVKDRFLVVQGKRREERDIEGKKEWISREFQRTFIIPKGTELEKLKSNLSKEGELTIEAPKKPLAITNDERKIAIEHTK